MGRRGRKQKIVQTDNLPEFVRIFLPAQCSEQLKIPSDFLKNFGGESPQNFMLESRRNGSFPVNVKKIGGNLFLDEGWKDFVKDHCLEYGDFLVFSYDGHSSFYVTIFGINSCRKAIDLTCNEQPLALEENAADQSRNSTIDESIIDLKYPSFSVVLSAHCLTYCAIPASFKIECKGKVQFKRKSYYSCILQLSNKSWPAFLSARNGSLKISTGWPKFVHDNCLVPGDACTFELIEEKKIMLSVSVFRSTIGRSHNQQPLSKNGTNHFIYPCIDSQEKTNIDSADGRKSENGSITKSECHFFNVTLSDHVPWGFCPIPALFRKQWASKVSSLGNGRCCCLLQLSDQYWAVVLVAKKGRCGIYTGWNQFMVDNNLKVGDVLSFEVTERDDFILKVSISRNPG